MRGPSRGAALRRPLWFVVVLLLFAAPVALVIVAPSLASLPASASTAAPYPGLPQQAPGATRTLDGLVDPLPIVVRSFPDAASVAGAADFDRLRALEPADALTMFTDVWNALDAPQDTFGVVPAFGTFLLTSSEPYGGDQSAYDQQVSAALEQLSGDPANADRLNNAAIALFVMGIGQVEGSPITGTTVATPATLERNALRLLISASATSPQDRAAVLNLAYLLSLDAVQLGDPSTTVVENTPDPAKGLLQPWLAAHPDDVTARYLLAAENPAVDAPLIADPATAALGYSAAGDAALADEQNASADASPGAARQDAVRALDAFDSALRLSSDPGLYAGRATALHILGANQQAVAAQELAVKGAPGSADLLVRLATLQGSSGDFTGMRSSARAAALLVDSGWTPLVRDIRYMRTTDPSRLNEPSCAGPQGVAGPGRGYFGYSYGSDRDHIPVWQFEQILEGCGGAGQVFIDEFVPQSQDPDLVNRIEKAALPDGAALAAIDASLVIGDPAGADADQAQWDASIQDPHLAGDPSATLSSGDPTYLSARQATIDIADAAAHLAHGEQATIPDGSPDEVLLFAQTALREAGDFRQAAAVCGKAAQIASAQSSSTAGYDRVSAMQCQGESEYLGNEYATAERVLESAVAVNASQNGGSPFGAGGVISDLVAAAVTLKDYSVANQYLQQQVREAADTTASEKLGEIALERGDLGSALNDFSAVLSGLPQSGLASHSMVVELAHTNRGVTLMRQSQPQADQVPDCASHHAQCLTAHQDFLAALDMDPGNADFLMNLAWADRALGDTRGETTALSEAVRIDPTLFPALNDLGVAAAESDDTQRAGQYFDQALTAEPRYDLAIWNLGVVEMTRGVAGIPRGEALLARAISLDHSLTNGDLAYKTDERIYTIHVLSGPAIPFNHSYSLAIVVLGSFSALVIVMLLIADSSREGGRELLVHAVNARVAQPVTHAVTGALSRMPAFRSLSGWMVGVTGAAGPRWSPVARPWLVTFPFLALITAVVALWTNSEARLEAVVVALLAALVAVAAHEVGHAIAARRLGFAVTPAPWTLGIVISLVMLPFRLVGGPYVGHQVAAARTDGAQTPSNAKRLVVIAAGPLANLVVAAVAAVLYVIQPLPVLLLILLLQVGMVAFSLLPFGPMEGREITHHHEVMALAFLLAMVAGASLFTSGVI